MKIRERIQNAIKGFKGKHLKEAFDGVFPFDTSIDSDDANFRSISTQARDMSPFKYERSVNISLGMYETNPLYRRLINFPIEAITSAGFKFESENPKVKAIIDKFWDGRVKGFGFRDKYLGVDGLLKEELLSGELNLPFAHFENGEMEMAFIEPLNIKQVKKVPGNALIDDLIVMKGKTGNDGQRFNIVREVAGQLFGDVFRFTVNKPVNASRGKPLFLTLLDWIDLHDQAMFNEGERWSELKTYFWDVVMDGLTEEQAEKMEKEMIKKGAPKKGSVRVHSESVKWEAVTPNLQAADGSEAAKLFRGFIGGMAIGGDAMLGFGQDINVATMRELLKMVSWIIQGTQREAERAISTIISYDLQVKAELGSATDEGVLTSSDDLEFTCKANNVISKDFLVDATGFNQLTAGIVQAVDSGLIAKKTGRKLYIQGANEFDFEIDMQEVDDDLEEQDQEEPEEDMFGSPVLQVGNMEQPMTPSEMMREANGKKKKKKKVSYN